MRVRSVYKTKIKRKRNWKPFFWVILCLLVAGALIYLFLFSKVFRIKNINAQATEKVSSDDLSVAINNYLNKKILRIVPANNYFLLSAKNLTGVLRNEIPAAKEIIITKRFPSALEVDVSGRKKIMTYCHGGSCFNLDKEGVIFEETPAIYGGMNVVLEDVSSRDIKLGDKVIEPELILFMIDVNKKIIGNINLSLLKFEIDASPVVDLTAITSEDWKIVLDPRSDSQAQISALGSILDEKIKDQRSRLDYIDLRAGNRVYYKMKQ